MAEKSSTLIIKVDLDCYRCHKKIGRILCKLQDKENIETISYDEKNNTVTISGPFDPQRLSAKLCCRGGKVIKDIQIKEKEKEKPKESKPAAPAEKQKPTKEEKPPEKEKKPAEDEKKPEKEKTPEKEEKPAKSEPVQAPQPICCPTPYYEGYYGGCRCCACGRVFGYVVGPPYGPVCAPPYDGYRVYHFYSEEDPSSASCSIM